MDSAFVVAIGFVASLAGVTVLSNVPLHEPAPVAVLAVLAFGSAFLGGYDAAVVVGGLCWLFADGFLVNRFGQLSWHGSADALRLAVFLGAAVLGATAGLAFRSRVRNAQGDAGGPQGPRQEPWSRGVGRR